jgi:hypothetical protein
MTRPEFELLGEMDQLSLVLSDGILLVQHHHAGEKIFLYEMADFYVIMIYDQDSDAMKQLFCLEDCTEFLLTLEDEVHFRDPASRPREA